MNRKELVAAVVSTVSANTGRELSVRDTEAVLSTAFEVIESELKAGNGVMLKGFGAFSIKDRAERKGKNPRTGAELIVPAQKRPKFKFHFKLAA